MSPIKMNLLFVIATLFFNSNAFAKPLERGKKVSAKPVTSATSAKPVTKPVRKLASSYIYQCGLAPAPGRRAGEVMEVFALRTPDSGGADLESGFSQRWITLKTKIQSDGFIRYALLESDEPEAVATGSHQLTVAGEPFEIWMTRKVKNSDPNPSHYVLRCQ